MYCKTLYISIITICPSYVYYIHARTGAAGDEICAEYP